MSGEKSVSSGQKFIIGMFSGKVADELCLRLGEVQEFLKDGNRVAAYKRGLAVLMQEHIAAQVRTATEAVNRFAGETTKLAYFYPRGWKASGLEEQRDRLMAAFPGIVLPDPVWEGVVTVGFDGPAYHIFPERLGLRRDIPNGNGDNYGKVIEDVVMPALKVVYATNGYGCHNFRAGKLGPNYIQMMARGRAILEARQAATNMDAFIAPVSLGQLWTPFTHSTRNAYETAILSGTMLPEGSLQVGCHLVAMPDRLTAYEHLFIDCPGDQYNWDADGYWADCPDFHFRDGWLRFDAGHADYASVCYGSAVASLGV
jgi:hypothetical protein